jgi:hypothetical protein
MKNRDALSRVLQTCWRLFHALRCGFNTPGVSFLCGHEVPNMAFILPSNREPACLSMVFGHEPVASESENNSVRKATTMKFIKTLTAVAFAVALTASLTLAADKPAGKVAGCCAKATKDGKTCDHACCVTAAKEKKNCEKCKGTNEKK